MANRTPLISILTDISAFIIFTDGVSYFIPGQREDSGYAAFFDALASRYFPFFDISIGAGWLFDEDAIEKIKTDFEEQHAPYVEVKISSISIHPNK